MQDTHLRPPATRTPVVRLAPAMAAKTVAIGRGVSLWLEAITEPSWRACVADLALRYAALPEGDAAARASAVLEAAWDHFVTGWDGVTDDAGDPAPCDIAHRDAVFAAAPALRWRASLALDAHLAAGRMAADEGNGSPAASTGASTAGPSTAPTAPTPPSGAA